MIDGLNNLERQWKTLCEREFIRRLLAHNMKVYAVGGWVRDGLMGREAHDLDLCVVQGNESLETLLSSLGRVHRVGASFPVWKFKPHAWAGDELDLSAPVKRGRLGCEPRTATLEEDLGSRDLTLNAMALDLETGQVVDPTGGVKDVSAKRLRAVHDQTFLDDPLRVLRTARFAGTLGFSVEPRTLDLMNHAAPDIGNLARERVALELHRLLVEPEQPSVSLRCLHQAKVLPYCIEPLEKTVGVAQPRPFHDHDVFGHTLGVVDAVRNEPVLRVAALAHDWGKPLTVAPHPKDGRISFFGHEKQSERLFRAWYQDVGLSMARLDEEEVACLVRNHMRRVEDLQSDSAMRRFLGKLGSERMAMLWHELAVADTLAGGQPWRVRNLIALGWRMKGFFTKAIALSVNDLAINGKDVLAIRERKPGPWVGQVLQKALLAVMDGKVDNEKEALQGWLEREVSKSSDEMTKEV